MNRLSLLLRGALAAWATCLALAFGALNAQAASPGTFQPV